ncbi:small s protein [Colletotrichum incanum]|uniref:Small s protein n=1 Tax=Colletotrichum incanum TaxID=1573173 RepID=A0A166QYU9_COLIC|nr:small s protein [Colletotrichum incanum]
MDPASAFGLAVNVLTVVDFARKILSAASEIYSAGQTNIAADRDLVAKDLESCCQKLASFERPALETQDGVSTPHTINDDIAALWRLATETKLIAVDIQRHLARSQGNRTAFSSVRNALRTVWGEQDMKEKMERLHLIRNELQFRIIVSLKANTDMAAMSNSIALQKLDEGTRSIIKALLADGSTTRSQMASQISNIEQKLNQYIEVSTFLTNTHHAETIDTIRSSGPKSTSNNNAVTERTIVDNILGALWFSKMKDRYDDIETAHRKTYEWVFSGSEEQKGDSHSFKNWVESSHSLFWVSGRAGTGKSTLMKYLTLDVRAGEAFRRWAGHHDLVMANHWFWSQGTEELHKSLRGLLQVIFYEIIKAAPAYGKLLFPDQFLVERQRWQRDFPTLHELKRAFKRLVTTSSPPAYVALFIDGLDEYAGSHYDHVELCESLGSVAHSKHIKIVVSSRPENAFESAFTECSKLHLHELTLKDRTEYVADRLACHRRIDYLTEQTEDGAENLRRLMSSAVEKSEGVFLWLQLVVQSLLEEMNDCDTIVDLQHILDQLPSGIESLFSHTMLRIRGDHRNKGMHLLHLVRRNFDLERMLTPWHYAPSYGLTKTPPAHRLTAIGVSVTHSEVSNIITQEVRQLGAETLKDTVNKVDYRLRSWCAGLLELRKPAVSHPIHSAALSLDLEVKFLHQSVAEFLDQPEYRQALETAVEINAFDPDIALIKGFLTRLKATPEAWLRWKIGHPSLEWNYAELILRLARHIRQSNAAAVISLLDELDRVMQHIKANYWTTPTPKHWSIATQRRFRLDHWTNYFPWNAQWVGQTDMLYFGNILETDESAYPTFLSFAISYGLADYAAVKLASFEQQSSLFTRGVPFLSAACRPPAALVAVPGIIRPSSIVRLLELGADPNQAYSTVVNAGAVTTPWKELMRTLHDLRIINLEGALQLADILTSMIESGADPNAEVTFEERKRSIRDRIVYRYMVRNPLQLIQHAFIYTFEAFPPAIYESLVDYDELLREYRPSRRSRCETWVGEFVPFEDLDSSWVMSDYPWINYFGSMHRPDPELPRISHDEIDRIKEMGRRLLDLLKQKGATERTITTQTSSTQAGPSSVISSEELALRRRRRN